MLDWLRLVGVLVMSLIDAAAAFTLGGPIAGLVVCLAGGWAIAQHDHTYQNGRIARDG